jgi:RHS repeat-associated protein
MPTSTRERLLSRYHYDPLDRLVNSTPFEQLTQRYYCKTRLATEIQSGVQRTIVQHDDQLLAQQQSEGGKTTATLLATDQQRSVLNALNANQPNSLAYSPYGHRPLENGLLSLLSLLGFNGERPDPVTGHYHLGNGYRQFNPVLMRFNSPDSWSPFGEGGLNAYGYCGGDPRNRYDPNGHSFVGFFHAIGRKLNLRQSKKINAVKKLNNSNIDPATHPLVPQSNFFDDIVDHVVGNEQLTKAELTGTHFKYSRNRIFYLENFKGDGVTYQLSRSAKSVNAAFSSNIQLQSIKATSNANNYTTQAVEQLSKRIRETQHSLSQSEAFTAMHPPLKNYKKRSGNWFEIDSNDPGIDSRRQ